MNAERRKQLTDVLSRIEAAKADLESIREAEQDAFDAMPESFQNGERGEKAQAAISAIEDAENSLDDALNSIETAKE